MKKEVISALWSTCIIFSIPWNVAHIFFLLSMKHGSRGTLNLYIAKKLIPYISTTTLPRCPQTYSAHAISLTDKPTNPSLTSLQRDQISTLLQKYLSPSVLNLSPLLVPYQIDSDRCIITTSSSHKTKHTYHSGPQIVIIASSLPVPYQIDSSMFGLTPLQHLWLNGSSHKKENGCNLKLLSSVNTISAMQHLWLKTDATLLISPLWILYSIFDTLNDLK